jgi:hypothetical protein
LRFGRSHLDSSCPGVCEPEWYKPKRYKSKRNESKQQPTEPSESKPQPTEPEVSTAWVLLPILGRIGNNRQINSKTIMTPRPQNRIGKVCALVAATLILPVLAYASQNGTNNPPNQNGNPQNVPVVPEANSVWVLIPFIGAVLLFSTRQIFRPKAVKE